MRKMQQQQGFTLIELMIVVAIIGILAAIAIPAYQDYTIRAKVSEPMTFLDAAKVSVAEYYQSQGYMPDSTTAAGVRDSSSQYIASVLYAFTSSTESKITLTVQDLATGLDGKTIVLTGTADAATGIITWDCSNGTLDDKYMPANCRG
jgi:type IV pilus assembly protein PilA